MSKQSLVQRIYKKLDANHERINALTNGWKTNTSLCPIHRITGKKCRRIAKYANQSLKLCDKLAKIEGYE